MLFKNCDTVDLILNFYTMFTYTIKILHATGQHVSNSSVILQQFLQKVCNISIMCLSVTSCVSFYG